MRAKSVALVALLFAVTAELLRATGPLFDALAGEVGTLPVAGVAIGLFVLPGVLLVTLRRASLPAAVIFLLLVRVTAQFAPNVAVVGAGAVLGLVALALAVQRAPDPVTATTGLLAGGALDLAIRSLTLTWDPIWIGLLGLPMAVLVGVALWLSLSARATDRGDVLGRAWCLGAYLALWTIAIGNPAFVAAQSGVGLQLSIVVMVVSLLLAIETVRRAALLPFTGLAALAGTTAGLTLALWAGGLPSLTGVVLAQLFGAIALTRAIAVPSLRGSTLLGLAWVLPVQLFQLDYFDNRWVPVVVAVALCLAGVGRRALPAVERASDEPPPGIFQVKRSSSDLVRPVTAVLALVLLVPLGFLTVKREPPAAPDLGTGLRLLSWNVKSGQDAVSGAVNPRQIADTVRRASADVVLLQEVNRGWAGGGGLDLAEWLSRDLDMAYRWGPGGDGRSGHLLLVAHKRKVDVESAPLPHGKSYLKVRIGSLDIVATQLAEDMLDTPARLAQIEALLALKPGLIVGNLNFWPSWEESRVFAAAGYLSAQDVAGRADEFTAPTDGPARRVDWVLGSQAVSLTGFRVMSDAKASDHFPIVALFSSPALASAAG